MIEVHSPPPMMRKRCWNSAKLQMTINGGPADALNIRVGRAAMQKYLNTLEEPANRNIMKFNKDKGKILQLRRNNILQRQNRQGTDWLGSISAGKDLWLHINSKEPTASQAQWVDQGKLSSFTWNILGCI